MEFPLALGLQKTGLPLIVSSGKLKNLCFLIDTGSSHNILFSYVYEHFKEEFNVTGNTHQIMGLEGEYKEAPIIIEATFNFEGNDYTSTFSVFNATKAITQVQQETSVQIHGILGSQFLMEHHWIVDFNKLMVYCYVQ